MDELEKPTPAGTLDKAGTPFDPATHAKYHSGRAMKTRDGKWFVNKGRSPKIAEPRSTPSEPPKNGVPEGDNPLSAKVDKGGVPGAFDGWQQPPSAPVPGDGTPGSAAPKSTLGKVDGDTVDANGVPTPSATTTKPPAAGELETKARQLVAALESAGRLLSPDLEHSPEERTLHAENWVRFYESGGKGPEISPGWAVAMGYGMMILQRLERPTFRDRCLTIWKKLSGK